MPRRYFNDSSIVKPGIISDELRIALGISKKSLPIWIHRMRILGYPPGWLKKADMTNTTINFIDGDNDVEEGQIDNEERTYNTDSFFEYPGFNAPVPKGVRDDYERLGMPPMQKFQQLNYAKQTVQSLQPVPHRRSNNFTELKDKNKSDSDDSVCEESDEKNDRDESKKSLESINNTISEIKEKLNQNEKELNENNEELNENKEKSNDEDEIIVLDVEKRVLCSKSPKKLNTSQTDQEQNSSSDSNIVNEENSSNQESKNKIDVLIIDDSIDELVKNEKKSQDLNTDSIEIDESERESTLSKTTLLSMGAPVPASLNGEKPPLENFAVGMGELIYFENLPTSTGVFDRMRKVIKKIRKKLS